MKRAAIVLLALAAGCGGSAERSGQAKRGTCAPTPGGGAEVVVSGSGAAARATLGPGMELKATKRNVAAGRRGGKPLVVSGTVRGEDCVPLAGATIIAWQTNAHGRYGPRRNGRDICCYLAGTVRTGKDGRYAFDTVMPRGYDGGPAHIHMEVGHPDAVGLVTELLFGAETNPQAVTIPLEDARDGAAELDLVLRAS